MCGRRECLAGRNYKMGLIMVEKIKETWVSYWPLLLLMAFTSGGSTAAVNVVNRLIGLPPVPQTVQQKENFDVVLDELRDIKTELRFSNLIVWDSNMEAAAWDIAGRELRKNIPSWEGPHVCEIKSRYNQGGKVK